MPASIEVVPATRTATRPQTNHSSSMPNGHRRPPPEDFPCRQQGASPESLGRPDCVGSCFVAVPATLERLLVPEPAAAKQEYRHAGSVRRRIQPPRLPPVSPQEVDEYLGAVEEPKRGTLQTPRSTILEIVPEAQQVISYRVPAFRVRGQTVAGLAAFKDHLSYLPFSGSVLEQLATELDGYTMTKSSLHFPVDRPLPTALVKKLITVRPAEIGQSSDWVYSA